MNRKTRTHGMRVALLGTVGVLSLTLAGCAAPESDADPDLVNPDLVVAQQEQALREAGADQLAELISDGDVSESDLFAAADQRSDCYSNIGASLTNSQFSPIDNVTLENDIELGAGSGTEFADALAKCDARWTPMQLAFSSTHSPFMDQTLMDEVRRCLETEGYTIAADAKSVADIVGDPESDDGQQRSAAERCTIDQTKALYPELSSITFSY